MSEENKNLEDVEEIIKKYIGVVLEDSKSNFGALADGQKTLERKVDVLAESVNELGNKVDSLVEDMDEVKARLTSVEDEVKGVI